MVSVKGIYTKGAALPLDPLEGHEGQAVIITFLEEASPEGYSVREKAGLSTLADLIQERAVETSMDDLAHQHDHSLYNTPRADTVLDLLRQLPPRERLRVLAQALPEVEQDLSESPQPLRSLRGLWKDLDFDISAEEIDEARREGWANFPREDI